MDGDILIRARKVYIEDNIVEVTSIEIVKSSIASTVDAFSQSSFLFRV